MGNKIKKNKNNTSGKYAQMVNDRKGEDGVLLKLQNIGKIYDSNDILTIGIRGVNLELDYNEFVIIEGESGSGKSTLLNVIGANDTYEEGELYFEGMETSHYSESEWEKYREQNIATVFQDFNIIENLTVLENVELALLRIENRSERIRIAKSLIERVGLSKQTNQKGSRLSGGEKQRTVIARALAKDSPIILADEPTGNLDVKSSKEVAALLKEVSKDKLVIVVTHNPEYFNQYATRKVRIYDGRVSEDTVIEKPDTSRKVEKRVVKPATKKQNLKNTFWLGVLNYKSRPRFTSLMSCALIIAAITVFMVLTLFSGSLIQPMTATLDEVPIEGKVIVSTEDGLFEEMEVSQIAGATDAGYFLEDNDISSFTIEIAKVSGMLDAYTVHCVYAPYKYALEAGNAVLVLPSSASKDAEIIKNTFLGANAGLHTIEVEKTLTSNQVILYIGYDDLTQNGKKIEAINSEMKIGDDSAIAYTFEINEALLPGEINLVNSNFWDVKDKGIVLSVKANQAYTIVNDDELNESVSGVIVQMNAEDYNAIFNEVIVDGEESCLYFAKDELAQAAIAKLPEGYIGLLSTSEIFVQDAGEVFTTNIIYYLALIAISFCFAMIISIIFMRSIKIYQTDFTVYRTLGISRRISSRSLYIQMALMFVPTLFLLPLISFVATVIPGSGMTFISLGNYIFIEILMLLIVEIVAYGFNKNISGQSIRKSLRRGSK